jgi:hypothetical protein
MYRPMLNNKLRTLDGDSKPTEDVFAIDTVLVMLSNNETSHNETHIDLGEWGKDFKLFSYDGFAYAVNENYFIYITYPLVKDLNKDERKDILTYRFGEEGAREKRKPRYGDVCLYYGRVVTSKPNKVGKASFEIKECDREAVNGYLDNEELVTIRSASGDIAYVRKEFAETVCNALTLKTPKGI